MKKEEFKERIKKLDEELTDLYNITFNYEIENVRANTIRNINGYIESMSNHIEKIDKYLNEKPMTEEVKQYLLEQYEKCSFKVVPGHWPNFETKEEVDRWIELLERLTK